MMVAVRILNRDGFIITPIKQERYSENMKIKKIELDYDEEADVMYITFGEPKKAVTEEVGNIGIRINEKNKEVVGLTIIEFMKTFGKKHRPINIPISDILKAH